MAEVILCMRRITATWRTVAYCPTCGVRRWLLAEHEPWYGVLTTCLWPQSAREARALYQRLRGAAPAHERDPYDGRFGIGSF